MIRIGSPAPAPFLAVPLLAALASPAAGSDVIYKVDGERLAGVVLVEEGLDQVVFQKDGKEANLAADDVLRVEVAAANFPRKLVDAVSALKDEDALTAYEEFDAYVDEEIRDGRERKKWAVPHVAWQTVELAGRLGWPSSAVENADRLIRAFPDSRYAPYAFLAKADAELEQGDAAAAEKTLAALETFIGEHALSNRWKLTHEWMSIAADPRSTPDAKRRALRDVVRRASDYPLVATRALVAEGETYITEADAKTDPKAAQELRKKAQDLFEQALGELADSGALAAAYAGIGESLFYEGASKDDQKLLERAADSFLRVIVLYPGESRYVPKSYFFAMRSFDLMGDRRRSRDMYAELVNLFPDSRWAAEAEKFRPK